MKYLNQTLNKKSRPYKYTVIKETVTDHYIVYLYLFAFSQVVSGLSP